jgi:aldehyde dehydrogenase (NAD+)
MPFRTNKRENSMNVTRLAYQNLELQPLAGQWRAGSAGRPLDVFDPFTQKSLLQITLANRDDLDEAYRKARETQAHWAAKGPAERGQVLLNAVKIFDERREEIIDWIIRESGSTRIKAQIEWGAARAITLESASLPSRVHGRIIASNIPGKESRVYRKPLGVIGVISPWNFPCT